MSIIKAN